MYMPDLEKAPAGTKADRRIADCSVLLPRARPRASRRNSATAPTASSASEAGSGMDARPYLLAKGVADAKQVAVAQTGIRGIRESHRQSFSMSYCPMK